MPRKKEEGSYFLTILVFKLFDELSVKMKGSEIRSSVWNDWLFFELCLHVCQCIGISQISFTALELVTKVVSFGHNMKSLNILCGLTDFST